jgi:hypothetical protein
MLRLTVSLPVCLGIKHPSGTYDQIFITVRELRLRWCEALSDERTGLSFTIAAGPRQRSHSQVRVPWDSRPYFTVSDSRLPFPSPPTTRRATVEVFDPAPTAASGLALYSRGTDKAENIFLLLRGADHTENTSHAIATRLVRWPANCSLATSYNIRPLRHSFHFCALEIVYGAVAWQCVDQIR